MANDGNANDISIAEMRLCNRFNLKEYRWARVTHKHGWYTVYATTF